MKNLKKIITLFLLVSILLSFAGCGNLFSRDGLSWDGSYYQLTDKDGVVVRIPLGVSLNEFSKSKGKITFWDSIFNITLQAPVTSSPLAAPLSLSKGGAVTRGGAVSKSGAMTRTDTEGDVVIEGGLDVLSAKAVFSFGSGEVKHPITGEVLCDPKGNPFVAHEKQVLVLQHTDKYHRAVELGSPDAYYLVMNIIDYMGKPGQPDDTGIIMAAQGDFLVNSTVSTVRIDGQFYPAPKNMVNYYIEWVEGPTPEKETQKIIGTGIDEFGICTAIYKMDEYIRRDVGWGALAVSQRHYYGDSNWNMSLFQEFIWNYDESDKELGVVITEYFYGEKNVSYENDNDGDGNYETVRTEVYYPNGQLKFQTDYESNGKSKSVGYYENGQLKGRYESDHSGEVPIDIWTTYDLSGKVDSTSDGIYAIYYYYDEDGEMIAWEKHGENEHGQYGLLESYFADGVAWTEQTYWDDGSLKSEANHNLVKGKSVKFYDESGNCTRWEKYYPNGQMEFWYDYVADKSEHYYENGQLQRQAEGKYEIYYYEDGRLQSEGNKGYQYNDDGTYIVDMNGTQYLYDKDGNLLGQCSYN